MPRVDVLEDATGITLLADLPGVPKDKLELKVEGDTLLIEGEVATTMPQELQPVYAEVRVARYRRAFTLSRELDPARIEASMKDGVLTIAGERPSTVPDADAKVSVFSRECASGSFRRAVSLPEDADPAQVRAEYRDGVLHISVARRQAAPPTRIAIQ